MAAATDFDPVAYRDTIDKMSSEHLTKLDGEAERLTAQLAVVNEQRRLIRNVMRTINPPAPKPKEAPRANGNSATPKTISGARHDELMGWLIGKQDEFTASDVRGEFGWAESQAAAAMSIFREEGLIRLARKGGKTGTTKFYRSMV